MIAPEIFQAHVRASTSTPLAHVAHVVCRDVAYGSDQAAWYGVGAPVYAAHIMLYRATNAEIASGQYDPYSHEELP